MPYTLTAHEVDFTSAAPGGTPGGPLLGNSVTASIFMPPASPPSIGRVTPVDSATATSGPTFALVFSSAAVPPTAAFDMLISDDTIPGDLFRSGQLSGLPSSPGTLNLTVAPTVTEEPGRVSDALQQRLPFTFPIPDDISNLFGFIMGASMFPQSITVNTATLTVGNPCVLTAAGSIDIKFFDVYDQNSGFTLTCNFTVAPSGDASDTSRIVKVTASVSSTDLIIDTMLLLPPAALVISNFLAAAIASKLENWLNERIVELTSDNLAQLQLQLTGTAVISAGRFIINSKGLNITLVAGDLFGPGVEPIPIPKYISIEVTPQWNCGVTENYTITVRDSADRSPIPCALVSLTYGEGGSESFKRHGTTDANGRTEFRDLALQDWVIRIPQKHGAPDDVEYQPLIEVSAAGFSTFTKGIDCPPLTGFA
jgi:hypothetical protein